MHNDTALGQSAQFSQMGELATKNMLDAGRQDKLQMNNTTNKHSLKNSSSSAIPDHVLIYIQDH